MRTIIIAILGVILSSNALAEAISSGEYYVSANRLSVRLGPSPNATITNTLNRKQKVQVFEIKNGWGRISKYYNGAVQGKSGQVARWVSAKYLSTSKPKDSFSSNSPLEKAIKGSDNYALYRDNFIKLSQQLISQGRCSITDYKEMGGWLRSSSHNPKPIYFTYCGGFSKSNKVYINAKTGKVI
jgi:hypothetical protein